MEEPTLFSRAAVRLRKRWRGWLRAIHRDVGYLLVGLTVVYAVSGLAVNHIDDWNASFKASERTVSLDGPLPDDDEAAVALVLEKLGLTDEPIDVFRAGPEMEIRFGANHTVKVDSEGGTIFEDYQEPRFFIRVANWLHLNRGKKAWTYIADGYAILLLYLALSGIFMLKGRKGFIGRGALLVVLGASLPIWYVARSGGPEGSSGADASPARVDVDDGAAAPRMPPVEPDQP